MKMRQKLNYDIFVEADDNGCVKRWWLKAWQFGKPFEICLVKTGKGEPPKKVLRLTGNLVCFI